MSTISWFNSIHIQKLFLFQLFRKVFCWRSRDWWTKGQSNSQRSRNVPHWLRNISLNLILFTFLSVGFGKGVCEWWKNKQLTFLWNHYCFNFITTQSIWEITRKKIKQIHGKNAPEGFHGQGLAAKKDRYWNVLLGWKYANCVSTTNIIRFCNQQISWHHCYWEIFLDIPGFFHNSINIYVKL